VVVQANIHNHEFNEVTLVWGSLRLTPISFIIVTTLYYSEYAQVKKVLGGCWLQAYCFDGKDRRCRIPGHFRKRVCWLV